MHSKIFYGWNRALTHTCESVAIGLSNKTQRFSKISISMQKPSKSNQSIYTLMHSENIYKCRRSGKKHILQALNATYMHVSHNNSLCKPLGDSLPGPMIPIALHTDANNWWNRESRVSHSDWNSSEVRGIWNGYSTKLLLLLVAIDEFIDFKGPTFSKRFKKPTLTNQFLNA